MKKLQESQHKNPAKTAIVLNRKEGHMYCVYAKLIELVEICHEGARKFTRIKGMSLVRICLLSVLLSACSTKVPLPSPISQPPLVENEPISVGIFYSEDLQHHKCIASKGYIAESYIFELGPASIDMFNLIFGSLFENIVILDSVNSAIEKGLKNVVEIRLLDFDGCEARWPIFGVTSIKLAYEATLYGEDGAIIAKWQGRGQALPSDYEDEGCRKKVRLWSSEQGCLGVLTCVAMRKAAADFIINFNKDPKVRTYLGK